MYYNHFWTSKKHHCSLRTAVVDNSVTEITTSCAGARGLLAGQLGSSQTLPSVSYLLSIHVGFIVRIEYSNHIQVIYLNIATKINITQ